MPKHWYQKNLRFLQTVLREIDIIDYDAKDVVEYMRGTNTNCLVVNAGGVYDFFENPLEMANENRFREGREILDELCEEIHKAGMHVIVRVDFRGVEPRRYNLHPDWFAVDQHGNAKIADYGVPGTPNIARPCYNSYYTSTHAVNFVSYIMKRYPLDGIWQNALGFDYGPCYCKNCRDKYKDDVGEEIPLVPEGMNEVDAMDLPQFARYRRWKAEQADLHIERIRAATKAFGEDKAYCAEIFDLYSDSFTKATGIDHYNAKKSFDFIVSCVFLNANHSPDQSRAYDIINNAASTIRFSRALDEKKQPVIVTGGNGTRWRYTADPALETRMWMWEIASVGGGIWNCYFNGRTPARTHDRRNAYSERDVYTYLAENSERLSDTRPVADVAVYYSNATRDKFCKMDEKRDGYGIFIKGVERVLLENHIQYGFLPDSSFSLQALEGVKTLVIPNGALMPEKDMETVRQYVKNGGGLVASFETSLYDEEGNLRRDFGLGDVLGVSYTGTVRDTSKDSYQLIADKNSPLLEDIGDTDMMINGGKTLLCTLANKEYNVVTTYTPVIPNQPPEYAWLPDMRTDYPVIVTGSYGRGRVVYFANQTDAQSFTNGHEDYTETFKRAIDFAGGGQYTLASSAPRSVHVNAIASQKDSGRMVVAMVNATGTSQRPLKEIVPVGGFGVSIPLNGRKLLDSKVLYGNGIGRIEERDGLACIAVDSLEEFASVELSLG